MITLKTLKDASLQDIFNQSASHLLRQNRKSYDGDVYYGCSYKAPNGDKCAVGCFISNQEYDAKFDSDPKGTTSNQLLAMTVPSLLKTKTSDLLTELQIIHDFSEPNYWREKLEVLANAENLTFNF